MVEGDLVDTGTVELEEVSTEGWIVPPCGVTVMMLPFAFFFDLGSEAAEVFAFFDCGSLLSSGETKSHVIIIVLSYILWYNNISCKLYEGN